MDNLIKGKSLKEPTFYMSVLFFTSLVVSVFITMLVLDVDNNDYIVSVRHKGSIKDVLKVFLLHTVIYLVIFCGKIEGLITRISLMAVSVAMLVGITTARLIGIFGFKGFLIFLISFLPHYFLLFVLYRHTLNKILICIKLSKTDYLRYGIILLAISMIHIFVSDRLAVLLI